VRAAKERLPGLTENPLATLPPRLRRLLGLVEEPEGTFTPSEVAEWFGVTNKTAREWLNEWREGGFVEPDDPDAERVRTYRLTESFRAKFREAGVFG
jgi:transposase